MAVAQATATIPPESDSLQLVVVAPPGDDHFAWAAARRLQDTAAGDGLTLVVETASVTETPGSAPDLFVMPVRSLAAQVAALQVLELPLLFPSLQAVHRAVDGDLGAALAREARSRGWEIVGWWDEGMHVLSGLKRYDQVRNLRIRDFLLTRTDPVAERQFEYWKAYTRRIDPQDREAVLRECVIASRATTLQQVVREQLFRVHLAVSLSHHRYEGWVVIAPVARWEKLDDAARDKLKNALRSTTTWQRADAQRREAAALVELQRIGMTVYEVDDAEREAFRKPLPELTGLLPGELDAKTRKELVRLASVAAAAVAGPAGGAADARRDPAPGAEAGKGDQRGH